MTCMNRTRVLYQLDESAIHKSNHWEELRCLHLHSILLEAVTRVATHLHSCAHRDAKQQNMVYGLPVKPNVTCKVNI